MKTEGNCFSLNQDFCPFCEDAWTLRYEHRPVLGRESRRQQQPLNRAGQLCNSEQQLQKRGAPTPPVAPPLAEPSAWQGTGGTVTQLRGLGLQGKRRRDFISRYSANMCSLHNTSWEHCNHLPLTSHMVRPTLPNKPLTADVLVCLQVRQLRTGIVFLR